MASFCLLCLNDNLSDLLNFTEIIDNKTIIEMLKIVHPDIDPNEMKCAKFMCKVCTNDLKTCLAFKEKYHKGYNNFKFYKDKLQNEVVIATIDIDEVKVEEDVIEVKETDREILQELINYEENSIPVDVPPSPINNQFPCYRCAAILPDEPSFKHHSQLHDSKTSDITSKRLRSRHLFRIFSAETNCKQYKMCQICNIIFTTQFELQNHVCQLKYQCKECLKKFLSKSTLDKHKLIHQNKCQNCNKKFQSDSLLEEHLKTHQILQEFQCDKCNRSFITQKSLKNHLMTHNRRCDICQKNFRSIKMMQQHKMIHNIEERLNNNWQKDLNNKA